MERYSTLWKIPENLFSQNSPVVVRAGAILKDNETNRILAQLKYENISDKPIKALKIRFNFFDVEKHIVLEDVEHQYLDISVNFKDTFGSNKPITLADKTVRSFEITAITVIFDNSAWESSEKYIPTAKPEDYLLNISDDLLFSRFVQETKNSIFWAVHLNEKTLLNNTILEFHKYKSTSPEIANKKISEYSSILNVPRSADSDFSEDEKFLISDIENVKTSLNNEKNIHNKKAKKRRKKRTLIVVGVILSIVAMLIAGCYFLMVNFLYNQGIASMSDEYYEDAVALFESIGDFKDSEEKLLESKFGLAEKMEGFSIAEAYNLYSKLSPDYPGVSERMEYLEQFLVYTEKYIKVSVIEEDGTGKVLSEEKMFANDAGITLDLCIKDGKLCYAPGLLEKYNNSSGTIYYEYAISSESEDADYEYYFEFNNGYGNNDYIYLSKDRIKIINKDLGLRGEEYDRITTTLYEK